MPESIWFKLDDEMNVVQAESVQDSGFDDRWQLSTDVGEFEGRTETSEVAYRVSTVFLALDHGFGGPPLYFETCVFGPSDSSVVERYATHAQAVAGHARFVDETRRLLPPETDDVDPEPTTLPQARRLFKGNGGE